MPSRFCNGLWSHTLGARSIYWVQISREEWNDLEVTGSNPVEALNCGDHSSLSLLITVENLIMQDTTRIAVHDELSTSFSFGGIILENHGSRLLVKSRFTRKKQAISCFIFFYSLQRHIQTILRYMTIWAAPLLLHYIRLLNLLTEIVLTLLLFF